MFNLLDAHSAQDLLHTSAAQSCLWLTSPADTSATPYSLAEYLHSVVALWDEWRDIHEERAPGRRGSTNTVRKEGEA